MNKGSVSNSFAAVPGQRRNASRSRGITRVISFSSGKGGVGKSNTVVNTALALAQLGRSVLVLDADLGLANLNVLLGLQPARTIQQFLQGECLLEEIMLDGPAGIAIIPAASGVESLATLSTEQRCRLMAAIEALAYDFDYLLIDTQAGIGPEVLHFNSAAAEIVCLINAEPTSLTDAYALIKVLARRYGEKSFQILANDVPDELSGRQAFQRLARAAAHHLQVRLNYLGQVPSDRAVNLAVSAQRAVLELYPSSPAGLAYQQLAKSLEAVTADYRVKGGMQFFFSRLLEVRAHGA